MHCAGNEESQLFRGNGFVASDGIFFTVHRGRSSEIENPFKIFCEFLFSVVVVFILIRTKNAANKTVNLFHAMLFIFHFCKASRDIERTAPAKKYSVSGSFRYTKSSPSAHTIMLALSSREIVLDVETCGSNNGVGRILEVGAVELLNGGKTIGESLHFYCNPEYADNSDMDPAALRKHKLSVGFLMKHKTFAEQYEKLRDFLGDSPILCHGTVQGAIEDKIFDSTVLDTECERVGRPKLVGSSRKVTNTNEIAKKVMPTLMPEETWRGTRKFYTLFIFVKGATGEEMDMTRAHSALYDAEMTARAVVKSVAVKSVGAARERSPRRSRS